jgi:hypothetical protein
MKIPTFGEQLLFIPRGKLGGREKTMLSMA